MKVREILEEAKKPGANIEELADAIIEAGEVKYIYYFARDVEGAPVDKLADVVIANGNAKYCSWFADDVKGAPKEKLMQAYYELTKEVEPEIQ